MQKDWPYLLEGPKNLQTIARRRERNKNKKPRRGESERDTTALLNSERRGKRQSVDIGRGRRVVGPAGKFEFSKAALRA